MTEQEWKDLGSISMIPRRQLFPWQKKLYRELLKKTEAEDEHPEDYEGPCFCQLCMSYGD